ncbi:hypothetical protein [Hominenteromicrobium sp.]|uniref:hypothetical protein n=1 Tax=Hominenteromicrobium sp. TaxID=3073581 RepID=UPI003AB1EFEF
MSFSFSAVSHETPPGELKGYSMDVVTSWDSSTYDPSSFEEQTIYGEVNRAELEKYFTIPATTIRPSTTTRCALKQAAVLFPACGKRTIPTLI